MRNKDLYHLYWDEGKNLDEIAEILSRPKATIYYWFNKLGIPRRTRSESRKGRHLSPRTEFKKGEHATPQREFKKGNKPSLWNKGLTKATDPRLKTQGEKVSATLSGRTQKDAKYTFSKEYYQKLYWDDDLSLAAIAEKLGCNSSTIVYYLQKYSIPRRLRSRRTKNAKSNSKYAFSKEFYEDLYLKEGLSMKAIAQKLGCTAGTPSYWLKKYQIPRRERTETRKPTGPERHLTEIIEKEGLPFKYVGNGEFILGGKCPDFLNTNGKKQLIELFGEYWHDIFDIGERTNYFKQFGFNTLIIWESELQDETRLVRRLRRFTKGGG